MDIAIHSRKILWRNSQISTVVTARTWKRTDVEQIEVEGALNGLPKEMIIWVGERNPKSLDDMTDLLHTYNTYHPHVRCERRTAFDEEHLNLVLMPVMVQI